MAAAPSKNSVFRLTMEGIVEQQAVVNVTHWVVEGANIGDGTIENLQAFVDSMRTRWTNNITPLLSERYQCIRYALTEITGIIYIPQGGGQPNKPREVYNSMAWRQVEPDTDVGGVLIATADSMPVQNTVTCRLLTAYGGRRWRGAIRYGGIPEDVADGTRLVKQKRDAFQDASDLLFANNTQQFGDVVAAVWKPVIYSKTDAFENYSNQQQILLYTRYITTRFTNLYIGSQNSRKIANQGM